MDKKIKTIIEIKSPILMITQKNLFFLRIHIANGLLNKKEHISENFKKKI